MTDRFATDATRRALLKVMAGGAVAGPWLGSRSGRVHAAPTDYGEAPAPLLQPEVLASISTPDAVEARLGTLEFFDRLPSEETVTTVYDAAG